MAVEVDTEKPIVPGSILELEGVDFNPFWQRFEYKHIHLFCSSYGQVGHKAFDCKFPPFSTPTFVHVPSSDCNLVLSSDVVMTTIPCPSDTTKLADMIWRLLLLGFLTDGVVSSGNSCWRRTLKQKLPRVTSHMPLSFPLVA